MNNDLILVQTSLAEFDAVEAGLIELETKYKGVAYSVATTKGMAEAVAARAEIRAPRIKVEKVREAGKKPIIELGRSLDRRAKEITARLVAIEEPIDDQIKVEEKRKAAEKAERERIESERIAKHQAVIDGIKSIPLTVAGQSSTAIQAAIDLLSQKDCTGLEEFVLFAENAKAEVIKALCGMCDAALGREIKEAAEAEARKAEEERLAAERKALAEAQEALRKQQEEARIKREAEEAEMAKRKREQEAAELAAILKREAEETASREAIAAAQAKVEADRKALQEQQKALEPVAEPVEVEAKAVDFQDTVKRTPVEEIVYLVNELLHDNEFMTYVEMFVRDDTFSTITNPFETFENLAAAIEKHEETK